MDGMGETYRTMAHAKRTSDSTYVSDLCFGNEYQNVPSDISNRAKESIFDWREGESAYVFKKNDNDISIKVCFTNFFLEFALYLNLFSINFIVITHNFVALNYS